jgi:hypothetical protein
MPPRTRTPTPALPEDPAPDPGAEAAPDPEAAQPQDTGGWFRNTAATDLTVLGDGFNGVLAPGRIVALERTPTHRDLQPATRADFRAQQSAEQDSADAQQEQPEDGPGPTTDTTEA